MSERDFEIFDGPYLTDAAAAELRSILSNYADWTTFFGTYRVHLRSVKLKTQLSTVSNPQQGTETRMRAAIVKIFADHSRTPRTNTDVDQSPSLQKLKDLLRQIEDLGFKVHLTIKD